MLKQDRLKELLYYNSDTGIFKRVIRRGSCLAGSVAGAKRPDGYIQINIDNKFYLAHRLAWFYTQGYFPENEVDHINRIKDDNRLTNLREVTSQCNARNVACLCNNTSSVKGVSWAKANQKWCSKIKVNGKTFNLGYQKSFDEAVCLRLMAEQCLNWSGCDSSSPAFQYVQKMLGRD